MTLTTRSGNRVTLKFLLIDNRFASRVDLVWDNYPPSDADVKECTRWIEVDLLPGKATVGGHLFDPPSGGQN